MGGNRPGRAGERGPVVVPGYNAGMNNGLNLLFVVLAVFVLIVIVFYVAGHA